MLSSRNKEFVQIGLFHPPSAIVSILANLCEPLKAFHKAILFFDPQSRITRDLQEKTRWWNQGYIYNGNTYLYVEREKDFHDLHVETILRRITDKGERGKSCEITERRKGGASNGGDKVWIMKPLVRGREPEIRASLTRPRSLLDSSEFRGGTFDGVYRILEKWMREGRREKGENYFLWRYERRVGNLVIISSHDVSMGIEFWKWRNRESYFFANSMKIWNCFVYTFLMQVNNHPFFS